MTRIRYNNIGFLARLLNTRASSELLYYFKTIFLVLPMKIAFIVYEFPKLSESFVVSQITGLLDLGHDVHIFADRNPQESEINADVLKYHLIDRTCYIGPIPENKTIRRLKTLLLIGPNLLKAPVRLSKALKILLTRQEGFSYGLLYYAFAFLRKDFDVIHCHFGPAGNIGSFLKQAGFGAKLITTFHGYDVTKYIAQHGPDVYKRLFSNGDLFTYNSEATKEKILALGCPPERMVKLPMGINLDKINFEERKVSPDGQINVLSVGRLIEMKGGEYAIKAVAKIIGKFPNVRYNIVGDGPLRESLKKLMHELGATDKIALLGWVSSDKLDSLYKSSHIFLHPSIKATDGNMEGQGVVLLEAMAYGLPVVATSHGAFPETVGDSAAGFLAGERDVDVLAERLEYLITNPQTWPHLGKNGLRHVEKHYNIKALNQKLLQIYKDLTD
jgi:colanic acid/amylovoran biosynthesis glycosyltransferase